MDLVICVPPVRRAKPYAYPLRRDFATMRFRTALFLRIRIRLIRVAACGTAAFRKEPVISADIAADPLWSGPAEKYRRMALRHGLHTAWSVPIVSETFNARGLRR